MKGRMQNCVQIRSRGGCRLKAAILERRLQAAIPHFAFLPCLT